MILNLAWRNIWRNPTRSMVVIVAIALGIWAAMFMSGFATGMVQSYVDNAIANRVSHLQIHHPQYEEDMDIQFSLGRVEELKTELNGADNIKGVSYRTLANGMLASSKTSRAVRIRGIDPAAEHAVTGLKEQVESGTYFEGDRKNQILLSERLADKLGVKLKKKVVLTFQDKDREIVAAAFRVVGIYDTGNNIFDDVHVFVKTGDIQRLLAPESEESIYHEAAILLKDKVGMDVL
ncbi:MAG: ABC transporter permease, partial [Bacteroidota bacterium]